jgi:hypothetical protein
MPEEEAKAFLQNMRWFAGIGRVKLTHLGNGKVSVKASAVAWSYWAG